jgi:hypothetical protein
VTKQLPPTPIVKEWLTPETMSPLGRDLMSIVSDIEQSDEPAFDEQAVERELTTRRGGYSPDD